MARSIRIEYPGAYYHVISRGQRKDPIFINDRDREHFLELLAEAVDKHGVRIHGYVLLGNHYHLLISTPRGNLVKAMKGVNTGYANWFKAKHRLVGGILQGRYKSVLVERDSYLAQVSAYIHLNPVRAGIVKRPEGYPWSSCRYYFGGKRGRPIWLETAEVLGLFSGKAGRYRRYVEQWMQEAELGAGEIYGVRGILGATDFVEKIKKQIRERIDGVPDREVAATKRLDWVETEELRETIRKMAGPMKGDIFERRKGNIWRKLLIYGLKRFTAMSLKEIGMVLCLDYTAVGQAHSRFIRDAAQRKEIRRLKEMLDAKLGCSRRD